MPPTQPDCLGNMAEFVGKMVSVMTVAADRYGIDGRLLAIDGWGMELKVPNTTYTTFVPWGAVIQVDCVQPPSV